MPARGVIFDMDGLLIDSEPLWVRAEIEVFGAAGVALSEDDCAQTKGLRVDDVVRYWHAHRRFVSAPSAVEERLVARVVALVGAEGRALPGVADALAVARAKVGRRLALASSSPSAVIDAALARLGLEDAFEVVMSAETEPFGKPHPGIFLRTAERLGIPAVDCLVLEDSMNGVIAAKAARMACIAVPFDHPDHDPRFVLADAVVGSLGEVSEALVAKLDAKR
jgi:mannitol-1-/sugar-/sorbitol-6-/2-deoxyglucose-6-phosphatase